MSAPGQDVESANERTPLNRKTAVSQHVSPKGKGTTLDKLSMSKENLLFTTNLGRAGRVTSVVLILAIPQILPSGTIYQISDLVDAKLISAVSLQYIFYIVQASTGATLRQWMNCFIGLSIASTTFWLLDTAFPGGCQEDGDSAAWAAMIVGCIYMVVIPWLNFPLVTVVFACSRYAIWWMQFTNPHVVPYATLKMELCSCFIGGLAAVTSTLVPTPMLACRKSPQICSQLAEILANSWNNFNNYYCGTERSTLVVSQLTANLANVFAQMSALETNIQDSWWECALFKEHNQARVMMHRQLDVIHEAYGRLLDVLNICLQEDFEDIHDAVVSKIKKNITAATDTACTLLRKCAEFSCDGDINESEAKELREYIRDLLNKEHDLLRSYHSAKESAIATYHDQRHSSRSLGEAGADAKISEKLMDEDAYCFEIASFCRLIRQDAEDLLDDREGVRPLPQPKGALNDSILAVWNSKSTPEQEDFALKTGMAIILAFFVGYLSSGVVLRHYDFSVAYLVGLLTKKGSGSALNRTLARLQGMIIGFVSASIGRVIIYNEFELQGLHGEVMMMTMVTVLVFGAMFLYFHGTGNNAFVGQLIAVVGTPQLVMRYETGPYNYRASQIATNSIVCVLFIMGAVNLSFGARVSDRAPQKLQDLWATLGGMLAESTNPAITSAQIGHGHVRAAVEECRYLGGEASEEPRYWRTPWRKELFDRACSTAERLRLALRSIQVVGGTNAVDGGERSQIFISTLQMTSFQELVRLVEDQHLQAGKMLCIFSFQTKRDLPIENINMELLESPHHAVWEERMAAFIREVNHPSQLFNHSRRSRTVSGIEFCLTDDVACQVSRIVLNLKAILDEIRDLQREIIIKSR